MQGFEKKLCQMMLNVGVCDIPVSGLYRTSTSPFNSFTHSEGFRISIRTNNIWMSLRILHGCNPRLQIKVIFNVHIAQLNLQIQLVGILFIVLYDCQFFTKLRWKIQSVEENWHIIDICQIIFFRFKYFENKLPIKLLRKPMDIHN